MATDIKLDEVDGRWVVVQSDVLKSTAIDFMLDAPERRSTAGGLRRAFNHNGQDGLTINFEGDYPGGVTVASDLRVTGRLFLSAEATTSAKDAIEQLQQNFANLTLVSPERIDQIEKSIESLAALMHASVVPAWRTKQEVEEGDDMGIRVKSASDLGFVVEYVVLQADPRYGHGDVVSIEPPPGTVALQGSTVKVTINLLG
jgi:hypothetical protein